MPSDAVRPVRIIEDDSRIRDVFGGARTSNPGVFGVPVRANGFLRKPFDPDRLLAIVRRYAAGATLGRRGGVLTAGAIVL
jgi:hypothetical protein